MLFCSFSFLHFYTESLFPSLFFPFLSIPLFSPSFLPSFCPPFYCLFAFFSAPTILFLFFFFFFFALTDLFFYYLVYFLLYFILSITRSNLSSSKIYSSSCSILISTNRTQITKKQNSFKILRCKVHCVLYL